MRVVGYVRCSTEEQSQQGVSLETQRQALEAEAARRGWDLVAVLEDVASGKTMRGRDGLAEARRMVESGEADGLMVTKLDRLSRSVADFASLLEGFTAKGYGLVILDLGVDTTTVIGEAMANVAATFAQLERRRIGERTREALAVKRGQGVRLGRPPVLSDELRQRIAAMRSEGQTLASIAATLERERVPTAHGGKRWHRETVRKIA